MRANEEFTSYQDNTRTRTLCDRRLQWSKADLVTFANRFAVKSMLLRVPPAIEAKTIGKMGLKGVAGLNIERKSPFIGAPKAQGGGGNSRRAPDARGGGGRGGQMQGGGGRGRKGPTKY
jgi:ATP-dependent RNA helicase MSS116